jgi:hypothetical protein
MVTGAVKPATRAEGRKQGETPVRWKAASASVRGAAHVRSGLPNQDAAMAMSSRRGEQGTLAIAAVADGHGSARHFRSRIGSSHAVNLAAGLLEEFLLRMGDPTAASAKEELQELQKKLVTAWRASVTADYEGNPFMKEETDGVLESEGEESLRTVENDPILAYGATLLATGSLGATMVYLQLGDGDILTVAPEGITSRPLPEDERLIANQTTSLCMPDAWNDFRALWTVPAQIPALVLLSTDGYMNSFRSERDFLQIGADYLQLLRQQGIEVIAQDLPNILFQASEEGSGDDISVALLLSDSLPGEEVKRGTAPVSAKSEMIHELTAQHAQQQKALSDLTERVEQAHRENHRLRRTLLLVFLVLLAGAAFLTRHRWLPYLNHGGSDKPTAQRRTDPDPIPGHKERKDLAPTDPGAGSPPAGSATDDAWELRIDDRTVPLPKGAQILGAQILGVPAKAGDLYAEVAQDKPGLELINRSHDPWAVTTTSGKKSSVGSGQFVVLATGTKITFRKGKSGELEKSSSSNPTPNGGGL